MEAAEVVTAGKAVKAAATEEAMVDATVVGSLEATKAFSGGFEKSFEDTTTSGTVVQATVQAAEAEEAVTDITEEAGEAAAEAVEAAQAMGAAETAAEVAAEAAVDWRYFLAATEGAKLMRSGGSSRQQTEMWCCECKQWRQMQQRAGEAEMVEGGMAAAKVEAKAAGMVVLGAAVEPVVWDTGEAVAEAEAERTVGEIAATVSEIVAAAATEMAAEAELEKQLRELQYKMEQLEAGEIEVEVEAAEMQVEATVGDKNKIFDPGGGV